MQAKTLITITNLSISGMLIYVKLLLHRTDFNCLRLYNISGFNPALKDEICSNAYDLALGVKILALISFVLALLLLKEKMSGKMLAIFNILLALVSIVIAVVVVN